MTKSVRTNLFLAQHTAAELQALYPHLSLKDIIHNAVSAFCEARGIAYENVGKKWKGDHHNQGVRNYRRDLADVGNVTFGTDMPTGEWAERVEMPSAYENKLLWIRTLAEVNQRVYVRIKIGQAARVWVK